MAMFCLFYTHALKKNKKILKYFLLMGIKSHFRSHYYSERQKQHAPASCPKQNPDMQVSAWEKKYKGAF